MPRFQKFQMRRFCSKLSACKRQNPFQRFVMHCTEPEDGLQYLQKVRTISRSVGNRQRSDSVESQKSFF